jgi:hypothetical protein
MTVVDAMPGDGDGVGGGVSVLDGVVELLGVLDDDSDRLRVDVRVSVGSAVPDDVADRERVALALRLEVEVCVRVRVDEAVRDGVLVPVRVDDNDPVCDGDCVCVWLEDGVPVCV